MSTTLKFKTLLAAGLAFFVIACNNNKSKKETKQEVVLKDITQDTANEEPPPPPPPPPIADPPQIEMKEVPTKCYAGDGLNYTTTVKISFGDNEVVGNVTSRELETGKTETRKFTGTINGAQLNVKFEETPPTIGAASEWTNKPWVIKKAGGKETLQIIFNAKNYDSNKWEDTKYGFALTDCK